MYVPMPGPYYGEEQIAVTICLGKKPVRGKRKLPDWRLKDESSDDDCPFEIT